jgi:hypothetical protein
MSGSKIAVPVKKKQSQNPRFIAHLIENAQGESKIPRDAILYVGNPKPIQHIYSRRNRT